MKIAIVHEMLIKLGGAERVLSEFMRMYPGADIYTLLYDEAKVKEQFPTTKIHCSGPAQWFFRITRRPRASLPLLHFSARNIDLKGYDVVISLSSGFAHHLQIPATTRHICYCNSPARYLWDWSEEVQKEIGVILEPGKKYTFFARMKAFFGSILVTSLFSLLRRWDREASRLPDIYIANSIEVQRRIKKYYQRDSLVLFPPVNTENFVVGTEPLGERKYYVITSALTPFKRIDIPVRVLTKLGISLKIIGSGDQLPFLQQLSQPREGAVSTIEFLGRISDTEVVEVYKHARGFLMPQKEDAGIAPLEAMAAGLPVFGQAAGGLLETSIDGETGRFFSEETDESFEIGFRHFHAEVAGGVFSPEKIALHAQKFNRETFCEGFTSIIQSVK